MSLTPYKILSHILSPFIVSTLWLKDKDSAKQRLGNLPKKIIKKAPFDLWMHGVSVGEIGVVKAIYDEFKIINPDAKIVISSFTDTGIKRANEIFDKNQPIIYYPVDIPLAVKKSVNLIKPRLYCAVETELWPNLLFFLKKKGTKLALLNGRISPSSFKKYKKISFFMKEVLALFDQICVISPKDKERFVALGARKERISICGNAKFEALLKAPSLEKHQKIHEKFSLPSKRPIIVAGSIRGKEHREVISALLDLKREGLNPILILVPRHLERVSTIESYLKEKGLFYMLFSKFERSNNLEELDVILIDRIGLLFDLYALCDLAFIGGSLIPKGGQNLMEPAAWQKPVLFGPYFYNFQDAGELLLEKKGGFLVKNKEELYKTFKILLKKRELRVEAGVNARKALEELGRGAASRQARVLEHLLNE